MISQLGKISEAREKEKYILIILDACRFDYFEQNYSDFFDGELSKVLTKNTYTMDYLSNTWKGEHDITYVAGAPVITDYNFEENSRPFRPSEHFNEIVDVWEAGYDKDLGVTPPEKVTESAIRNMGDRMVVHYFQPHAPYIGDFSLTGSKDSSSKNETIGHHKGEKTKDLYQKIEEGEIDESELRKAYEDNLIRVLESVKQLIGPIEDKRPIYITADHGEILGENGRFMHGGLPHPKLNEVPWLKVDRDSVNVEGRKKGQSNEEGKEDEEIKKQLQNLGYMR